MMKADSAELSLVGNHQENQDRMSMFMDTGSLQSIATDGMECHAEGRSMLKRCSFALAGLRN
jgi:hypothetical protein